MNNNKENSTSEKTTTIRIEKDKLIDSLIPVVLRQTDYDEGKAKEKLQEHNFNLKSLLYEYMGINLEKKEKVCVTSNQERYRVIRNTFDQANKKFW